MNLILCLLLLSSPLEEKKKITVVCPLDGHTFTATQILRTNDWGGVDLDFCRHAYKTRPMEFYVWVCPRCNFAGKKKDFTLPLTEEEKTALLGKLTPLKKIEKGMKQSAIPAHVKYDLRAQVKILQNASALEIGRAYLEAAWTFREEGAIFLDHFDEWERVWKMYHLDKLPLELGRKNRTEYNLGVARKVESRLKEKTYKPLDRTLREYLVAYLYRKHGELPSVENWITSLEKKMGANSVIDAATKTMKESVEQEKNFLRRALPYLIKAGKSPEENAETKAEVSYVVAEIHRRLGEFQKAYAGYDHVLRSTESKALKELATRQKSALPKESK